MNRTKLDEIMNEEINGAPPDEPRSAISIYAIDRIAERAFRHGVERVSEQLFKQPGAVYVQPAPAEEKVTTDVRTYPPCAVCGGAAALDVHYGHAYDPAASPFTSGAFNRRKDQRRKDSAMLITVWPDAGGTEYFNAYESRVWPGAWIKNRRSGSDRRKMDPQGTSHPKG